MAYEFTKAGEVDVLEYMPENSNILVESGGDVKRLPSTLFSGGSGGNTYKLNIDKYGLMGAGEVEIPYEEAEEIFKAILNADAYCVEVTIAYSEIPVLMKLTPIATQILETSEGVMVYAMAAMGGNQVVCGMEIDRTNKVAAMKMEGG